LRSGVSFLPSHSGDWRDFVDRSEYRGATEPIRLEQKRRLVNVGATSILFGFWSRAALSAEAAE
jgi:hypothetical protein